MSARTTQDPISQFEVQHNIAIGKIGLAGQAQMLNALLKLAPQDAAGVACSMLLYLSETQPKMLERLLNEPVVREGFTGVSLLETFKRVARS